MHGVNFIIPQMLVIDLPKLLTGDEAKKYKSKKTVKKINSFEQMENILKQTNFK